MFERLQKPFLTVETGEAYQPIRVSYQITNKSKLIEAFEKLGCLERKNSSDHWTWYWQNECDDLHFESLDSFKKNPSHPIRLATITIKDNNLYLNLPSFKRACLGVPFFYKILPKDLIQVQRADFINKVFGLTERLPHGFSELFKEEELEKIVQQRVADYEKVQAEIENAATADEAFNILSTYTKTESEKRLPFAERYEFSEDIGNDGRDPDVVFLGFYIFLRGRELVAIRRWFGETGYTLANAAEDTIAQVFGNMDIDIIE